MIKIKHSIFTLLLSLFFILITQPLTNAAPQYILNVPYKTETSDISDPKLKTDTFEINKLSKFFNIDKDILWHYYNSNISTYELKQIAYLAYVSQKPFSYVATLKKTYNISYIKNLLKITPNDIENSYEQLQAEYLAQKLSQDKKLILKLLQQKFGLKDIGYSLLLSPYCNKSPEYILNKLNTASGWYMNNAYFDSWKSLAQSLDIPDKQLQEARQIMEQLVPEKTFYNPSGSLNLSGLITYQLYLQKQQ